MLFRSTAPPEEVDGLIRRLRDRLKAMFTELTRQGQHGVYSNRASEQLRTQLTALQEILNPPVGLSYQLLTRHAAHTASLQQSLDVAVKLAGTEQDFDGTAMLPYLSAMADLLDQLAGSPTER